MRGKGGSNVSPTRTKLPPGITRRPKRIARSSGSLRLPATLANSFRRGKTPARESIAGFAFLRRLCAPGTGRMARPLHRPPGHAPASRPRHRRAAHGRHARLPLGIDRQLDALSQAVGRDLDRREALDHDVRGPVRRHGSPLIDGRGLRGEGRRDQLRRSHLRRSVMATSRNVCACTASRCTASCRASQEPRMSAWSFRLSRKG